MMSATADCIVANNDNITKHIAIHINEYASQPHHNALKLHYTSTTTQR